MQDDLLTKPEAAAFLGSKDPTGKAIDRLVTAGQLSRIDIPRVGKRYRRSELQRLKDGFEGLGLQTERGQSARASEKTPKTTVTHATHHEAAFAPADGLFASAAATAVRMNTMWQQGGMDSVFANSRKSGEPLLEWPALIASAHDEPAVVLVRWDSRAPLTKAFVAALVRNDTAALLAELDRLEGG